MLRISSISSILNWTRGSKLNFVDLWRLCGDFRLTLDTKIALSYFSTQKKSAHLERSMRHIFPDYPRRFRTIGHPPIVLGGRVLPRRLPQLDQLQFFRCVCSLTTTIHTFSRWQATIFPHTFSSQLFRWLYILNVFPCVKYNFSIHILYTIFRSACVIYHSQFSVCVFCV